MPVYINRDRAHDQGVQTRRYSTERAEWYDGMLHAFLDYCDRIHPDELRAAGFSDLDAFREEGKAVIVGNRDFWREKSELGEDDPFVEMKALNDTKIDPSTSLTALQERFRPQSKSYFMNGGPPR